MKTTRKGPGHYSIQIEQGLTFTVQYHEDLKGWNNYCDQDPAAADFTTTLGEAKENIRFIESHIERYPDLVRAAARQ